MALGCQARPWRARGVYVYGKNPKTGVRRGKQGAGSAGHANVNDGPMWRKSWSYPCQDRRGTGKGLNLASALAVGVPILARASCHVSKPSYWMHATRHASCAFGVSRCAASRDVYRTQSPTPPPSPLCACGSSLSVTRTHTDFIGSSTSQNSRGARGSLALHRSLGSSELP